MKQIWLDLHGVGLRLGAVDALSGLSVQIGAQERVALVGANGSGKSSLLRLINGLVLPSSGKLLVQSQVSQAMVFQRPFMLRASVSANLGLAAWLRGVAWAQRLAVAHEALQSAGLQDLAHRQARTLSGGQQQLLALARAMLCKPQVLLLDEPTANLAPHAKRAVEDRMAACADAGMGLVFATHNLGQVKRLASRVLWLDGGKLAFDGSTDDFFSRRLPGHAVSAANLMMETQ